MKADLCQVSVNKEGSSCYLWFPWPRGLETMEGAISSPVIFPRYLGPYLKRLSSQQKSPD